MYRIVRFASILLVISTLSLPGFADVVTAFNAGPLPAGAQDLTGDTQPFIEIVGTFDTQTSVDMFAVTVLYPLQFAVFTFSGPFIVADPELFLFDSSGLGVMFNDDVSFTDTQSCLPSPENNPCPSSRGSLGPITPGTYFLAITQSTNAALSSGGDIFSNVLSTDVVGPDLSQGGGSPITGWDNNVSTSPNFDDNQFDILIQDTPEPSLGFLTAAFVAALVIWKRRHATIGA